MDTVVIINTPMLCSIVHETQQYARIWPVATANGMYCPREPGLRIFVNSVYAFHPRHGSYDLMARQLQR